jgi:serine/threonine protein phosphatase PrpC
MGGKILMNRLGGLLAVTRAFGDFSLKKYMGLTVKPEVRKLEIRLNHRFVIVASDGLWDFVGIKAVQKILKEQQEADDIARTLVKTALAEGSVDNITVIVVKL